MTLLVLFDVSDPRLRTQIVRILRESGCVMVFPNAAILRARRTEHARLRREVRARLGRVPHRIAFLRISGSPRAEWWLIGRGGGTDDV